MFTTVKSCYCVVKLLTIPHMFAGADRVSAPRNYPENDHDPDSNPFFTIYAHFYYSMFPILYNIMPLITGGHLGRKGALRMRMPRAAN